MDGSDKEDIQLLMCLQEQGWETQPHVCYINQLICFLTYEINEVTHNTLHDNSALQNITHKQVLVFGIRKKQKTNNNKKNMQVFHIDKSLKKVLKPPFLLLFFVKIII